MKSDSETRPVPARTGGELDIDRKHPRTPGPSLRRGLLSRALAAGIGLAGLATLVEAHPGGLDAAGCHTDRKTGAYHCHRSERTSGRRAPVPQQRSPSPPLPTRAEVASVTDGDTLRLENGERVRLIGVDTPETVHPSKGVEYFGREATSFTRRLALGKRVRLEYDPANAHLGHKDRYRRTLAYVFLPDGRLLNAEIIRLGYGFAYTRFPFGKLEEFRRYEREASQARRGLWGRVGRDAPGR